MNAKIGHENHDYERVMGKYGVGLRKHPQSNMDVARWTDQESDRPCHHQQAIQDFSDWHKSLQVCRYWNDQANVEEATERKSWM